MIGMTAIINSHLFPVPHDVHVYNTTFNEWICTQDAQTPHNATWPQMLSDTRQPTENPWDLSIYTKYTHTGWENKWTSRMRGLERWTSSSTERKFNIDTIFTNTHTIILDFLKKYSWQQWTSDMYLFQQSNLLDWIQYKLTWTTTTKRIRSW